MFNWSNQIYKLMYLKTDKLNAEKRRVLYHQRHKKDIAVIFSPGWYSSMLLW